MTLSWRTVIGEKRTPECFARTLKVRSAALPSSRIRSPNALLRRALLFSVAALVTGCSSPSAIQEEVARVRALCTAGNLLRIDRPDLYRLRSAQTRRDSAFSAHPWKISGGDFSVIGEVPFGAETSVHYNYLMHGSVRVASLKYIDVHTKGLLIRMGMAESTPIFNCTEPMNNFYLDLLRHEFRRS